MNSTNNGKPDYKPARMPEIRRKKKNGYKTVSTFSGCGGSCLGYRMAGFEVVWANEFVEAARDTYRENHASFLDERDIRTVQPEEILEVAGLSVGDLDVLEGSPPCASFSTSGNREKDWNKVKKYSDTKQRTDDLFFEYIRLLKGLKPKVFTAENVSGLIKGSAKGYFKGIIREMKDAGYRVSSQLLDAQWLGVPQRRQRIIFIGVREDLKMPPAFPKPLKYYYSLGDVFRYLYGDDYKSVRLITKRNAKGASKKVFDENSSSPTVMAGGIGDVNCSQYSIEGLAIGAEWDKIRPGQQSEKYFNLIKPKVDKPCPTVTQAGGHRGAAAVVHPYEKRKFTIPELRLICGFPEDFKVTGTYRQQWERLGRSVPPMMMYHIADTIRKEILDKV